MALSLLGGQKEHKTWNVLDADARTGCDTIVRWMAVHPDADSLNDRYDDETLARLHAILDEAQRAAGQDETIEARIAFLRLPLEYTPICRDYRIASESLDHADKWQWRTYFEHSVRRTTWLQKLGPSWAIHTPWLIYQDY